MAPYDEKIEGRSHTDCNRGVTAPFLLSLVAILAGVVGLISAATPAWHGRMKIVADILSPAAPHVADGVLVAASFGLVLVGRGLARRRRRAWQAAVVLLAAGTVLHLLKGLDFEEAAFDAIVLALLITFRREFDALGDPGGPSRALSAALIALGGLFGYGIAASALHAAIRGGAFSLTDTLETITFGLIGLDASDHPGRFQHDLTLSIAAATVPSVAYVLWLALRPRARPVDQGEGLRVDARRLVERHGRDSLSYFALRRDKSYFFNDERTAFVAYRVTGGVALVSGDPVGDPEAISALLREFLAECHRHAWRIAVLGVGSTGTASWHEVGLRTLYVGDEAVVLPAQFSLEGRAIRKVRQSCARLQKAGYRAVVLRARDLTVEQRRQVGSVNHFWLRGQPERGFSMSLDDLLAREHGDGVFTLVVDEASTVAGFVHFVPAPATGDLSLSAMRRLHDTPNGLMEFALCETFAWAREQGIARVSLNFNAFGELLRTDQGLTGPQRLLRRALSRADRFFQVERLLDFNRKFFPEWQPRYAAFERYSDLPLAALVMLSSESLVTWPETLRRLGRGPGSVRPRPRPQATPGD